MTPHSGRASPPARYMSEGRVAQRVRPEDQPAGHRRRGAVGDAGLLLRPERRVEAHAFPRVRCGRDDVPDLCNHSLRASCRVGQEDASQRVGVCCQHGRDRRVVKHIVDGGKQLLAISVILILGI